MIEEVAEGSLIFLYPIVLFKLWGVVYFICIDCPRWRFTIIPLPV